MTMLPPGDPGLNIADTALSHIKALLASSAEENKPVGLRVHVKKAGCSGYEYDLSFAYRDSQTAHDFLFEKEGIIVLVDQEIYIKFLKGGTTLEYVKEGLNEGLQFKNPNVVAQCGCGESFTLND
ncbi:MAG: iron-sulfur cluster assembly accessory protein [Gammaproteobacteria bacterium]